MSGAKGGPKNKVRLEIDIWYDRKARSIRIEAPGHGFFTTVCRDARNVRGHEHLFDRLADNLRRNGASAPPAPPRPKRTPKPPKRKSRSVWITAQAGAPGLGKRR